MNITAQLKDSAAEPHTLKFETTQTLTFIKMSLDYAVANGEKKLSDNSLSLEKLRIIEDADEKDDDGDSDDEDLAPGLEGVEKSEHMTVTAVNLLLTLLERESHQIWSPALVAYQLR